MSGRKESKNPTQETKRPQKGEQSSEDFTPPPSFREIYQDSALYATVMPLGRLLGYGAHSDVYQGKLTGSGQNVTIKVDRRPIRSTNEVRSQFDFVRRKIERLNHFKHPGMAELIDWIPDWENNRSFIIMRYIEGRGLNQALDDHGPFPQAQVLNWAFQLLDVMEYLHAQGCVIGDFDASNIALTPDKRVCLVDFKYWSDIEERLRSRGGADFGLYNKMDEDALADGIRRDIYHLGELLFELLTGRRPKNLTRKGKSLSPEECKDALANQPGVSPPVAEVILRAMSPQPNERYPSAADMRRTLQELPVKDMQASFQMWALAGGVLLTLAMLMIGAFCVWKGQYQSKRYAEMSATAMSSAEARRDDDYSAALSYALAATRSEGNDPPCPPEAQSALADILGAYDYNPGYKPFRSFPLVGQPINARISPDGRIVAVLAEDAAAYPATKRIQAFDAESGRELAQLTPAYSPLSDFLFLDSDTLLYAGANYVSAYSFSEQRHVFDAPMGSSDRSAPVGMAVSADGKTAASVLWGSSVAYLYDVEAILKGSAARYAISQMFRPPEPYEAPYSLLPLDASNLFESSRFASMDNLLALSGDGQYLALTLPNGGLRVYDLFSPTTFYDLLAQSYYTHFEGGFYRDYFFYTASATAQSENQIYFTNTQCELIRLSDMETELWLNRSVPVHTQADEDGIFLSVGDYLYQADTNYLRFRLLAQTDGTIRLLRHAAGRILAVTESGQVLTFRDDGAWKTQVTQGAFNVAGLSERYAFLATRNKPMLSAFEWTANGNDILTYYNDEASNEYEYYEHLDARVNSDGQTAMLFRSTGFRIYNLESGERIDANSDSEETKFEREASALIYQRGPRLSDDPAQECLKVIASNGVSFYSATSGKLLYSRERREADDYPVYFTQSYKIEQKGVSAPIEILQQRSNAPLKTVRENLLISASQYEDYLILSLSTLERERYSLILDKNLDVIGRVPGPCDALPANTPFQFLRDGRANGALIFDDMQGRLLQGSLYTLEDLWSLAINWRMETE